MIDVLPTRTERILKALSALGDRYVSEFVESRWQPSRLKADWYQAFKFFLWHLYFQGRNDEMSGRFFKEMAGLLDEVFRQSPAAALERLWSNGDLPTDRSWEAFDRDASTLWGRFSPRMGKRRDWEMVLDVLRHVHGVPGYNVVTHSLSQIEANRIAAHRTDLQKLRQVGPKTSAFYLRDLVFLYDLQLSPRELLDLQPVDTWVRQVRAVVDPPGTDHRDRMSNEEWFVQHAAAGYDSGRLNAGAWYLGKHAFRLSLALLGSVDVRPEQLESLTVRETEDY